MSISDIKKGAEQKMARSVESFKTEIQKIRTGRAHPGILDQVHVDYHGSMLPIKVFSIFKNGALKRVVMGEDEGTLVHA